MDCPNYGAPLLRWPYQQEIKKPGETLGHCPWCMELFPIGKDVPKHQISDQKTRTEFMV